MASIFTYDPDPPRVLSPWLHVAADDVVTQSPISSSLHSISDRVVTRLEAEPQQGPTEYKLHLLLRPRRTYTFMSTACRTLPTAQPSALETNVAVSATSRHSRHERLKHLTTQLLWRLQQSSPYHASSSKELSVPKLLDESIDPDAPVKPQLLVPGLEESRGALYELGVSDDGILLGLTRDEMSGSIATLRVMAASLGCTVHVLRMVVVGDCEWVELTELVDEQPSATVHKTRKDRLWVAEALVTPNLGPHGDSRSPNQSNISEDTMTTRMSDAPEALTIKSATPQLRVILTGQTNSGKSSLLGTLSTGTLDNGRGKSRLSLLKHRHEIVSGVTSSIAQELIGYKDREILNLSRDNIESWTDIHDCAKNGRLGLISDSGGHPRYRRTVLRGLMSWAPHWNILCIAADATTDDEAHGVDMAFSSPDISGTAPSVTGSDIIKAHLGLALKLDVPSVVVVTKLDLATKSSLHKTMTRILTFIKESGRTPKILKPSQCQEGCPSHIESDDQTQVQAVVDDMVNTRCLAAHVPILLTSAVKGTGIGLLHALLASLPLVPMPTPHEDMTQFSEMETLRSLFHINDIFNMPSLYQPSASDSRTRIDRGAIVSGYVRFGGLSVGHRVVVGPFPATADEESSYIKMAPQDRPSVRADLSCTTQLPCAEAAPAAKTPISATATAEEWKNARVVSIRNLRLPVCHLEAGQAGSVGLVFELDAENHDLACELPRVRRGMVLALAPKQEMNTMLSLKTVRRFVMALSEPEIRLVSIGSLVIVYFASVRAAARVIQVSHQDASDEPGASTKDGIDQTHSLGAEETGIMGMANLQRNSSRDRVTLELLHNREWIEMGSKVLLLEGGSQNKSGPQGYVGRIVAVVDD